MTTTIQPITGTFAVDPIHSLFQFSVRHMGVSTFSASFDDVNGRLTADEQGVRLEGAVRVASLSIKLPDFRGHVVDGPDFFDATKYPEMSLRSTNLELLEDGTVQLEAELTIKGITKPITATGTYQPVVQDLAGVERTAMELEATVDRRDWGFSFQAQLPKGGDALGNKVRITARVELVREA
jgi:polyisoprenoid-binding protein YceI